MQKNKALKEELIDDNNLLIYIQAPDNKVYVKIRFLDKYDKQNEHYVARFTMKEYLSGDKLVFNEDKTAIAVFKEEDGYNVLENFYNIEEHSCACSDFLDCAYYSKFNTKLDNRLRLIKK